MLSRKDGHILYNNYHWQRAALINDGESNEYKQPSPKQRILAALYDIKKMQEPQYPSATSEILEKFKQTEETPDKILIPETI